MTDNTEPTDEELLVMYQVALVASYSKAKGQLSAMRAALRTVHEAGRLAGRVAGLEEAATIAESSTRPLEGHGDMVNGSRSQWYANGVSDAAARIRARLGDTGTLASRNGEIALEVPEIRENTREKLGERPLGDTGNQEDTNHG